MKDTTIPTRERILQAAIARFSRNSYTDTGLRDLADDVRVDVSYVHRCFGSKKALFTEALEQRMRTLNFPPDRHGTFGEFFAELADGARTPAEDDLRPLDMIVASLGNREAKPVLREAITNSFVTPLATMYPEVSRREITLALAMLMGVAICARVLELEPLADTSDPANALHISDELRDLLVNHVSM